MSALERQPAKADMASKSIAAKGTSFAAQILAPQRGPVGQTRWSHFDPALKLLEKGSAAVSPTSRSARSGEPRPPCSTELVMHNKLSKSLQPPTHTPVTPVHMVHPCNYPPRAHATPSSRVLHPLVVVLAFRVVMVAATRTNPPDLETTALKGITLALAGAMQHSLSTSQGLRRCKPTDRNRRKFFPIV